MRLLGMVGNGGKTVARELKLIVNRQDVGRTDMSVDQSFAVEIGESFESRSENIARFGGSEGALREKLREIFLGAFHHDIEQIEIAETRAAGLKDAQQVWMGKRGGMLPAK